MRYVHACEYLSPSLIVSRLVKHTGFGNAAGLLMSRGLLGGGGGTSEGAGQYSSDSDNSDTEEYQESREQ